MTQASSRSDGFPMAVIVEGALALIAVALAWLFSVPLRDLIPPFGAPFMKAIGRGLIATIPMLAMFWCVERSGLSSFRQLRRQVESLINEMFPEASVGQLALIATLAGVGEELLFRGVFQTVALWWTTPIAGVVIVSVLFGGMHAVSKLYFALATAIGLYFGWMTWNYHDLVAPMVAHGVYDFVVLLYLTRRLRIRS